MTIRPIAEQAGFWKIDLPAEFISEFADVTFGRNKRKINVLQWNYIRRALKYEWSWVAGWIRVGYPEPPTWLLYAGLADLLSEVGR